MRSSNLGTAMLSVSIGFAFAGILFSNLSWIVLSVGFAGATIYARTKFVTELRRTNLEIDREVLDSMVFAGEPAGVKVEVLNIDPITVRGTFEDIVPPGCTIAAGTNRSDRVLPPRTVLSLSYSLVPYKRGPHLIPGMRIERTDAFGLFSEEQVIERRTIVNAHTKKDSFDAAKKMAGREHLEFAGISRNPALVLREQEFDGIREYVPGDRARDIHWKLLSKLGKMMTKTYKKEGTLQTMIFVDCSRSMRLKTSNVAKLDHAIDLSMQLSNVLLSGFHPAGAAAFDETAIIGRQDPGLGRNQFDAIARTLREAPGTFEANGHKEGNEEPSEAVEAQKKESRLVKTHTTEGTAFMSALDKLSSGRKKNLGLGLEGAIKEIAAKKKGQEQLFIVFSDLGSTRDAVLSGAKISKKTGNRMLVIQTYDDWYNDKDQSQEIAHFERGYERLSESLRLEAALRANGALYIRIGPADTAPRIIRSIRRGKA